MGEELFHLALMNLMRARARLAMTSGGVLVGTAAVILLIALTIGLQQAAEAQCPAYVAGRHGLILGRERVNGRLDDASPFALTPGWDVGIP